MKNMKKIFILLNLLFLSLYLNACSNGSSKKDPSRYFYLDSVNGSDSNDGLSENTAWQSIDKVNNYTFVPGDAVLFRRGQEFSGGINLKRSGNASNAVIFDAWGTGDRPVLLGSQVVTGWTDEGSSIYSKFISGYIPGETGAGLVLEDGTALKFKKWNNNAVTSFGADNGVYTYNPGGTLNSATLYIRCTDTANPATHIIRASYHHFGIHGVDISYITVKGLHFKEYSCHALTFESSSHISVENCKAENIGGAVLSLSPLLYGGNGFEFTLNSSNCSVTGSEAVNIFDSGFSPQVFESNTVTSNITFDNCTASRCGFAGIEISVLKNGTSSNEKIENVTVKDCIVSESGAGWSGIRYGTEGHGIRIKADTNTGTISGVSISDTTVRNCEGSGIYIGGETSSVDITRSKISANKSNGIACAGIAGVNSLKLKLTASLILNNNNTGTTHGVSYSVVDGSGFEIINNTFYNNSLGLYIGACGGAAVLKNNIFYAGSAHLYTAGVISNISFDYNCYFDFGNAILAYNNTAYDSVAAYSADTTLDSNSLDDNPSFVSGTDYHLQGGSPCKSTGTGAGVILDYDSNTYSASPSRGAYQ